MEELHEILNVLHASPQPAVLATILHVAGSAYRKAGTCRLLLADGTAVGVISAGCLEADLQARFHRVYEQGVARTHVYDLRAEDDLSWGQGAGCAGVVQVLIEPVDEQLRGHLLHMQSLLQGGTSVLVVKLLTAQGSVAGYEFLTASGQHFGNGNAAIADLRAECWQQIREQSHSGVRMLHGMPVYLQLVHPKPRLLIIGAGPDARPLAAFAAQAGYSVTVADWRPDACSRAHFPQADALVAGPLAALCEKISFTARDAVVLMTHHFQRDQELLRLLLKKEVGYLGVLGPRQRTSRLLAGEELPDGVRSPVGLLIGAEGPEEIAISILAEIIATRKAVSL